MPDTFSRLPAPLRDALAAGTVVVTPNKRLARRLVLLHDEARRAAGSKVWPAAVAMPWEAWLRTLWHEAIAVDDECPQLLAPQASAHLWQRIVGADALPLLDIEGAASLAADAWSLVQAWGSGGESWRSWRDDYSVEDTAAFARWAELYRAELTHHAAIDGAQLADTIARIAARLGHAARAAPVLLAGFIETTPQQQRLLTALRSAGVAIDECTTLPAWEHNVVRTQPTTPHAEVRAALAWAAEQVRATPGTRVGIVVEDLAARRAEVLALAHETLAPATLLPGNDAAALPFNVTLGQPLADVPLAASALQLIGIAMSALPMGEAAALLRSPYLPSATEQIWMRRAALERTWLEQGRKTIAFDDVLRALGACDATLAQRWREARAANPVAPTATPRQWVDHWRAWLRACGWPGSRTQDSAEWQAREAWETLLTTFAGLGTVDAHLSREAAWSALGRLARTSLFQPESASARIEILGVLEAAGLAFDALWVAGLTAERWPPAPSPNPLLPIHWQRERGVPRASAARELAYANTLTELLAAGAPTVVMSSALREGDAPLLPSALILPFPEVSVPQAPASYVTQVASASRLERLHDATAPALTPGEATRGGAAVIAHFADCPFQALAGHRLRAEPWPAAIEGLSAAERGTLLHAALAHFWHETKDQATLLHFTPDELTLHIQAAARVARSALDRERWTTLPAALAAGEGARLARTLALWLAAEKLRPSFAVSAIEAKLPLVLGGMQLQVRLDRIDTLADGGAVIIDYKSGLAEPPGRWFDRERPRAPQLGLYALAHRAAAPDTAVRAVVYGQLRPDRVKAVGLASDAAAWPALTIASALDGAERFADWHAVETWWSTHLGAMAAGYASGRADVAPREAATCGYCARQQLCRIGRPSAAGGEDPGDA